MSEGSGQEEWERGFSSLALGTVSPVLFHLLPTDYRHYRPQWVLTRPARFAWLLEELMVKKDCEVD